MLWADASWFIAVLNPKDQWSPVARELLPEADAAAPLACHALAAGEVIAYVGTRLGGKAAREAWLLVSDSARIRCPVQDDLDSAMERVVASDGKLSLSDALFVHWMGPDDRILSFDGDFDGWVKRLPAP